MRRGQFVFSSQRFGIMQSLPAGNQRAKASAVAKASAAATAAATLSIPGWSIVRDPSTHAVRRLIWSGSLIACLALAAVHGVGLVQRYRTYPTRVQLDVSNRQGMPLPAVTVCPLDRFDVDRLGRLWRSQFQQEHQQDRQQAGSEDADQRVAGTQPDPVEQYYQLAGAMPIDELWRRIAYSDASDLFPMCYVGRGKSCDKVGRFQTIWTPSGTCFTISSDAKTLSGHFHGLYLRLNISYRLNELANASGWKITMHGAGVSPWLTSSRRFVELTTRYEMPGERTVGAGSWPSPDSGAKSKSKLAAAGGGRNGTVKSQFMYGRLAPKEFIRADHPRQRCSRDEATEADCEIDCIQNTVASVAGCKLPYMTIDGVPFCNSSDDVRRTESLVARLVTEPRSHLNCRCLEPCTKVVYMYEIESHTVEVDYGRIKIFYDTPLWVTVREVFVYSWVKLLCDAGNILCLLLGASVLSLFELADLLAVTVTKRFKRRN